MSLTRQVNTPHLNPSQRPALDLPTPRGWKVTGYILRWFTCTQMVTHWSTNPAVHGWESDCRPVDHKSDTLTTTPSSHKPPGLALIWVLVYAVLCVVTRLWICQFLSVFIIHLLVLIVFVFDSWVWWCGWFRVFPKQCKGLPSLLAPQDDCYISIHSAQIFNSIQQGTLCGIVNYYNIIYYSQGSKIEREYNKNSELKN